MSFTPGKNIQNLIKQLQSTTGMGFLKGLGLKGPFGFLGQIAAGPSRSGAPRIATYGQYAPRAPMRVAARAPMPTPIKTYTTKIKTY